MSICCSCELLELLYNENVEEDGAYSDFSNDNNLKMTKGVVEFRIKIT